MHEFIRFNYFMSIIKLIFPFSHKKILKYDFIQKKTTIIDFTHDLLDF